MEAYLSSARAGIGPHIRSVLDSEEDSDFTPLGIDYQSMDYMTQSNR